MNELENLYADYKRDLEGLLSFIKTLLNAAENEYNNLTSKDMEYNIEQIYEKTISLHDKLNIFVNALSDCE